MNILDFRKNNRNNLANTFYYDMLLKYFLPIDVIPPRDEGFAISREFYRLDDEENIGPLAEAKVGDVLKGHLTIVVPKDRNFVSIEDFIPAGMEIVNLKLATEDQSLRRQKQNNPYFNDYFDGGRGLLDTQDKVSGNSAGLYKYAADIGVSLKNIFAFSLGSIGGVGELVEDEN